jgi:5-methylcytosine-specific restriction endonuclease McrA
VKAQLAILKKLKAPNQLVNSFKEVCEINARLSAELRASPNLLLEEQCRKLGFEEVLPEGYFFRPHSTSEALYRADCAQGQDTVEAPAIEQAYRRGFSQGFAICRELVADGAALNQLKAEEKRIHQWRFRTVQKYGSAPGSDEKIARNLFGTRHGLSLKLRYQILKRDGERCKICGRTANGSLTLHVDHIVPYSKGGLDDPKNLQPLCNECNLGKSDTE